MSKAWMILVVAVLASAAAYAQTTASAPSPSELNLEWSGRSAIQQPLDAVALAKKAGQFKTVVAQGHFRMEGGQSDSLPQELRKMEFSVTIQMPAAKLSIGGKLPEFRCTDGVEIVGFRPMGPGGPNGMRRKLATENLYASLGPGAILYDALGEYQNVMSSVTFKNSDEPSGLTDVPAGLKWFELTPLADRPHFMLRDTRNVRVGLDADTGLPRAVVGIRNPPAAPTTGAAPARTTPPAGEPIRMVVTFDEIKTDVPINPDDLLLPADAAKVIWQDAATKQPTSAPAKFLPAK